MLDHVVDLVDASLASITDGWDGEPRISLLETVRSYALESLRAIDGLDQARQRHARHYLTVADPLEEMLNGSKQELLDARRRFELEHDNIREALTWAFESWNPRMSDPERAGLGLAICSAVGASWADGGYYAEGRQWLERAIVIAESQPGHRIVHCLENLARFCDRQGDLPRAHELSLRTVESARTWGDSVALARALRMLANCEADMGNVPAAEVAYESSIALSRQIDDKNCLASALSNFADFVGDSLGQAERCLQLQHEALDIWSEMGLEIGMLIARHNIACTLEDMGQLRQAHSWLREIIPQILEYADSDMLMDAAEDNAAVLAALGHAKHSTRILGAAEAMRERKGVPRAPQQETRHRPKFESARAALASDEWKEQYLFGQNMSVEDALLDLYENGPTE